MTRHRTLAATLLVALFAEALLTLSRLFVVVPSFTAPTFAPAQHTLRATQRRATETETEEEKEITPDWDRPDIGIHLDGDKLDNLDEWYKETIAGRGGYPRGFMRDLVLRSFFGTWNDRNYFTMSRDYTGENGRPSDGDYVTAYMTMKAHMKEGKRYLGQDDGRGWIWLVAGQNPGGLHLYLMKSPPYGERPLALIRQDDVDEFFDKVDWHRLYVRLHKWQLWGGTAKEFPFPMYSKKR
mmetsp:Transcript_76464/g.212384  ORF Transcript_76464/g.212384 Transcript_76464/m.212384 type:complete len:239 (-) Transcript_76464:131-847(-)